MRVTVLFFAQLRDLVGLDRAELNLPDGACVQHALDELFHMHPAMAQMRARIATAVNERFQPPTATLSDGCTLGLIPPVSGG